MITYGFDADHVVSDYFERFGSLILT